MKEIKTTDKKSYLPLFKNLTIPEADSHKGQNGKVLVVGGSTLFHAASLWAAEVASHFVDMVHYASTEENNEIFLSLKKKFRNGIIISRKELFSYAREDDSILIGPGLVREDSFQHEELTSKEKLFELKNEAAFTYHVTEELIKEFPTKKFVLDAGALQMMKTEWFHKLETKPIITPHQLEFERLFGIKTQDFSLEDKANVVKETAKKFNAVILLKAVKDIISNGEDVYIIEGGNAGLTKGGSGDILAGLTAALLSKNSQLESAVMASVLVKKTAEKLFETDSYWYNMNDLIDNIPHTLKEILSA